jgi:transposase
MAEATDRGIGELARFACGLQHDLIAIKAGLTLEWSNGVTEGHIHRLTLVKRQGYGRAGAEACIRSDLVLPEVIKFLHAVRR